MGNYISSLPLYTEALSLVLKHKTIVYEKKLTTSQGAFILFNNMFSHYLHISNEVSMINCVFMQSGYFQAHQCCHSFDIPPQHCPALHSGYIRPF